MIARIAGVDRHVRGWTRDLHDHRDLRLAPPAAPATLPKAVDLRAVCPPIFDQGRLGSCTANAGCAAHEFLQRQAKNDQLYSRLYLYYRTRQIEGTAPTDDAGAQIRDVFKALAQFGVCPEASWPYDVSKFSQEPPPAADLDAAKHKALFYYRCPDLWTLKACLSQGFPAEFGFDVFQSFMSDATTNSGIAPLPADGEQIEGGHAVLAVGYDDSFDIGNGITGAVLCQNSWGESWGQGGFFWLPYWYFATGHASDVWTLRRVAQ